VPTGCHASVQVMPTVVGVWENYKLYLERSVQLAAWHRNVPSYFTFDDHELVNDIWGTGTAGKRHRRTVFRDIGTHAFYDYLGWANPVAVPHDLHFGKPGCRPAVTCWWMRPSTSQRCR
jgi:alkaline phosphatase D